MNSDDMIIWLQGFLEATGELLSQPQVQALKAKLATVKLHQPSTNSIPPVSRREP